MVCTPSRLPVPIEDVRGKLGAGKVMLLFVCEDYLTEINFKVVHRAIKESVAFH